MRHIILATGLLFCAAWIAGCSAKEEVVKPEPLPKISKTVKLEKVWARRVGDGLDKQFLEFIPAVNDTAVCAASVNGVVACYQRDNGRKVWRRNLKESLTSGVAMGYGQVFVGTQDGQLLALSQENGETLWGASLSSEALAPPAVGGGQVSRPGGRAVGGPRPRRLRSRAVWRGNPQVLEGNPGGTRRVALV